MAIVGLAPRGAHVATTSQRTLSPRPDRLSGGTLAIVENGLGNSGVFFDALVVGLAIEDDYAEIIRVSKPSVSVPPAERDWAVLKTSATFAITGFGGCGSCSARSMRDAIELDWLGIPSMVICHEVVEPAVRAIARLAGHPDYPLLAIGRPHTPLARWDDDEAESLAHRLVPQVRAVLLGTPATVASTDPK